MKRFALAFAVLVIGSVPGQAETTSKTVRDWSGSCDSHGCSAEVTGVGGLAMGGQGYKLVIARAAGKHEPWYLKLYAHQVPQPDGKSPVSFRVAGAALPATTMATSGDGDHFGVTDQPSLDQIFPALRKGAAVEVAFTADDGPHNETFSLSGLAAVLLWIDDRQGRVGNSAKVAAADGTAGAATLNRDAADSLREELQNASPVDGCQWSGEGADASVFGAEAYDLGGGYTLYIVQCSMGAYQPSTLVFLRGADGLRSVPFADYGSETGWRASLELGFADFDPKSRTLHNYTKFRGSGDCGTASDFQWNGFGFKLLEYRYKECSDEPLGEEADMPEFPVIYQFKQE